MSGNSIIELPEVRVITELQEDEAGISMVLFQDKVIILTTRRIYEWDGQSLSLMAVHCPDTQKGTGI